MKKLWSIIIISLLLSWLLGYLAERKSVAYTAPKGEVVSATVTAYTSSEDETDENPWETASGTVPGPGTIACPSRWPFGTRVEIEGKMYRCEDRMHARYREQEVYDIWLESKEEAWEWGRRQLTILVHR